MDIFWTVIFTLLGVVQAAGMVWAWRQTRGAAPGFGRGVLIVLWPLLILVLSLGNVQ